MPYVEVGVGVQMSPLQRKPQQFRMNPASGSVPVDGHTLDGEKGDFPAEAPRVASELSVAPDHAMAWNDDRKRIGSHGLTDRARGARHSHLVGDVPIRHDSAVGNFREPLEDAPLEWGRSGEVELKMEALSPSVEILIELMKGDPEGGVCVRIPVTLLDHLGRDAPDSANPIAGDPDRDGSGGRIV